MEALSFRPFRECFILRTVGNFPLLSFLVRVKIRKFNYPIRFPFVRMY